MSTDRGHEVAAALRQLGVHGVLITAAKEGYITELACGMPECLCPEELGGRSYFVKAAQPMPDWAPNHEHSPIPKRELGHRDPDNTVLAHVLCNRVDYAKTTGKPYARDLARVELARRNAIQATTEEPT